MTRISIYFYLISCLLCGTTTHAQNQNRNTCNSTKILEGQAIDDTGVQNLYDRIILLGKNPERKLSNNCNTNELLDPIENGQMSNDNPPVPCGYFIDNNIYVNECSPCGIKVSDDDCINAPISSLCALDGFESTTMGITNDLFDLTIGFCGGGTGSHNNSWLGFTAQSPFLQLQVTTSNCIINEPNAIGLQCAIVETNCLDEFTLVNGFQPCFGAIFQGGLLNNSAVIDAENLIPGNDYYIMVDGFAGGECDFRIDVLDGLDIPELNISVSPPVPACSDTMDPEMGANVDVQVEGIITTDLTFLWLDPFEEVIATTSGIITAPNVVSGKLDNSFFNVTGTHSVRIFDNGTCCSICTEVEFEVTNTNSNLGAANVTISSVSNSDEINCSSEVLFVEGNPENGTIPEIEQWFIIDANGDRQLLAQSIVSVNGRLNEFTISREIVEEYFPNQLSGEAIIIYRFANDLQGICFSEDLITIPFDFSNTGLGCEQNSECLLNILEVGNPSCNPDGTYSLDFFYTINNATSDLIDVSLNGGPFQTFTHLGNFAIDNIIPRINSDFDIIEICQNSNPNCCDILEYLQPDCSQEECRVEEIDIIVIECLDNGNYDIELSYNVTNSNKDFIDITINNGAVQSFENNGTITLLDVMPRLNSNTEIIEICLKDNPSCCGILEFPSPNCSIEPTDCNIMILEASLDCGNSAGDDTFIRLSVRANLNMYDYFVFVNGINIGLYTALDTNIEIGPIDKNNDGIYLIEVIDCSDYDCRDQLELTNAFCNSNSCSIGPLNVAIQCEENDFFIASLTFPYDANHQEGVKIMGNGTDYGSYDGFSQPIVLNSLLASANNDWEFVVIDNEDLTCQTAIDIGMVTCEEPEVECIIESVEVFDLECIGGNEYSMSFSFETGMSSNTPFTFFINGVLMNTTLTSNLPLNLFGVVPSSNSDADIITICLDETIEVCCVDFAYAQPACLTNSVDATLLNGMSISPNPTSDMLYLHDIPGEIIGLKIIDNLGRNVAQISSEPNLSIDVSNYSNGVYIIQFLIAGNYIASKRFIKL